MSAFEIELRSEIPSMNSASGMYGHWSRTRKAKRAIQEEAAWALRAAKVPKGAKHVHAEVTVTFSTRRRRDAHNFWLALKAISDAAVQVGVIVDDTAEFFSGDVVLDPEPGRPRAVVVLDVMP